MTKKIKDNIPRSRFVRIIPICLLMYMVAYMDRNNIGFAFDGMASSLNLSPALIGTAGGIFFIGYVLPQIPIGYLASRFSPVKILFFTQIIWGILACATAFVQSGTQLLVIRFILGVAEAALYPCLLVLIANWFPLSERARANGLWQLGAQISSLIMGPISGIIITNFDWRWMFIIQGLPALFIAIVWLVIMKDSPDKVRNMSEKERAYLKSEHEKDLMMAKKNERIERGSWKEVFASSKVWILCLSYFLMNMSAYGVALWLPKIIQNLTHSGYTAVGFISILPALAGIIGLYLNASHSDKTGERRWHAALSLILAGVSLLLSTFTFNYVIISVIFLVLTSMFIGGFGPIFWSIPPMILSKSALGPSIGLINGIGNLGGFFGPMIVGILIGQSGSTTLGLVFLGVSYICGGLCVTLIKLKSQNQIKSAELLTKTDTEDVKL